MGELSDCNGTSARSNAAGETHHGSNRCDRWSRRLIACLTFSFDGEVVDATRLLLKGRIMSGRNGAHGVYGGTYTFGEYIHLWPGADDSAPMTWDPARRDFQPPPPSMGMVQVGSRQVQRSETMTMSLRGRWAVVNFLYISNSSYTIDQVLD